jgi:hypothetical protein
MEIKSGDKCKKLLTVFFFLWRCGPTRTMASSFTRFLDHTQRRTTVGRTPLDEWSARRRDLYLTKHNTHNRQISMPPVGFESTISAGERPQTYVLDRAATGTGTQNVLRKITLETWPQLAYFLLISFSSLSNDRSKASSKASSPHSAI